MPIYEYLCEDCDTKFEKLVRNGESIVCPSCGEAHLKPQLSTFSARANSRSAAGEMPSCPGGMCQNPGMCGRN